MKIALVGYGYLGKAYHKVFPDAVVYDPYNPDPFISSTSREQVNDCDMAIVMVPTDPLPSGELDMSVVAEVVGWLQTDLILIKSALMPGTVDHLINVTGKNIAVSVEYIGMGSYYVDPSRYPDPTDPRKHDLLVVGGETGIAEACANILWAQMSPATRVHIVSAREAEIVKLVENAYGALKVTFANTLMSLTDATGSSYIRTHQAWSEDGRTDPMHTRVDPTKRGWKSHCYDKDIKALAMYARKAGAHDMDKLFSCVIDLNNGHLKLNE